MFHRRRSAALGCFLGVKLVEIMRRALLTIAPFVLGLCLVVAGLLYDVQYAGIPYQDPTPEQQAQYNLHSSIATRIMRVGSPVLVE